MSDGGKSSRRNPGPCRRPHRAGASTAGQVEREGRHGQPDGSSSHARVSFQASGCVAAGRPGGDVRVVAVHVGIVAPEHRQRIVAVGIGGGQQLVGRRLVLVELGHGRRIEGARDVGAPHQPDRQARRGRKPERRRDRQAPARERDHRRGRGAPARTRSASAADGLDGRHAIEQRVERGGGVTPGARLGATSRAARGAASRSASGQRSGPGAVGVEQLVEAVERHLGSRHGQAPSSSAATGRRRSRRVRRARASSDSSASTVTSMISAASSLRSP